MKRQRLADMFDAIGETVEDAENFRLRADLMRALAERIASMSQKQAADLLGVTQPRISNLMRGKIGYFGLDRLVNMAAHAGLTVTLTVQDRPLTVASYIPCQRPQ